MSKAERREEVLRFLKAELGRDPTKHEELLLRATGAPEYVAFLLIYPWMKEKLVQVAKTPETWSVPLSPR